MSCVGRKWLKKGINNDDGSAVVQCARLKWKCVVGSAVCVLLLTEPNELLMVENVLNGIIFMINVK